jgi:deaminated glutathione amidase
MTKIAVLQMRSGIEPQTNCDEIERSIVKAHQSGAKMLFTPEMGLMLDTNRARSEIHIHALEDDPCIARLCKLAAAHGIWLQLGSTAFRASGDGMRRNCALMINDQGQICASYDKIHLFDVDLPTGESWRESAAYAPGQGLSVVQTHIGKVGLSVCYDVRFPALYNALTDHGAEILSVPAAFTAPTGEAHWHILLRARAIENAAFVVASAQAGHHQDGRKTYGHSLVIDPWGTILLDMKDETGLGFAEIDLDQVAAVRSRIPVLKHRRHLPKVDVQR